MTGVVGYVRSHRLGWAGMGVGVAGVATFLLAELYVRQEHFYEMALIPAVAFGPLVMAVVIGATVDEPAGEISVAAPRRLRLWTIGHVLAALTVAALCLVPLGSYPDVDWGLAAALRNLAGFTGLALLTATVTGGVWAWTVPVAYGMGAYALEGLNRSGSLLAWPLFPDRRIAGHVVAVLLLAAGLSVTRGRTSRLARREW
ncbi:MAG: hypothetical protein WD020_04445 [Acidimicrobiia bacterium]